MYLFGLGAPEFAILVGAGVAYGYALLRLRRHLRDRRGHYAEELEDENRRLRDELARRGR